MFFSNGQNKKTIEIGADEVGLVTAKIGANLPPGETFGKTVECKDFQDDRAFVRNGGQRGRQRAILIVGTYQINTESFSVEIVNAIHIPEDKIGLVEARDGTSRPLGQGFGRVVECNNFQNAQAFVDKGGQCGKQLAILLPQTYRINTNIFMVTTVERTRIEVDQVGLVIANIGKPKPVGGRKFGRVVECNHFQDAQAFLDNQGEFGEQSAILTTSTYSINTWLFEVRTAPVTKVPQGEIGLVIANDGKTIPTDRQLGKVVECNHFQDAQAFIDNGGESGRQLAILRDGKTYQINTSLFTVITSANATQYNLQPEQLKIYVVGKEKIGIVTTLDGKALPEGEIAGSKIKDHNNFQNPQKFIEAGGFKGLQQEFLTEGLWVLNPWFVKVEQVPLVEIPTNCVGVIISYVGQPANSQLVEDGYKGIQAKTLSPGKYPINTKVKKVYVVPTSDIILKWYKSQNKYDDNFFIFEPLQLRSKNRFIYELELIKIIFINGDDAPDLIHKIPTEWVDSVNYEEVDSVQVRPYQYSLIEKFVNEILHAIIYDSFVFAARGYGSDQFINCQQEIQWQADDLINARLHYYKINSNFTLILKLTQVPHEIKEE